MLTGRLITIGRHLLRTIGTAQTDKVIYNKRNPYVVEAILNKEKALNALDHEMIKSLSSEADDWSKDGLLKAILLRGMGKKAFCAGGDVKSLYEAKVSQQDKTQKPEILDNFFRDEFTCDYKMASLKPSLIALWDGIVMGGGVGISINAPFKIATENSMFAMPEGKIGFFTDVGGGYFLARLHDNIGLYLGLTSQKLKGKDLVRAGLAHYYLPSENITELEQRLFDNPKPETLTPEGIATTLKDLCEKVDGELPNLSDIKRLFDGKSLKEVVENLEKESSQNKFAEETLKLIRGNSPLSLRVTWDQIKKGRSQSLRDALIADYRTCQKFMDGNEFFEGVRCLLVDRKDTPKWQFKSIEDVPDTEVAEYFMHMKDQSKELKI